MVWLLGGAVVPKPELVAANPFLDLAVVFFFFFLAVSSKDDDDEDGVGGENNGDGLLIGRRFEIWIDSSGVRFIVVNDDVVENVTVVVGVELM